MIRQAKPEDLPYIIELYGIAREYMRKNGNDSQWGNDYPGESLLKEDIGENQLYLLLKGGEIHGVFAFIFGADPCYEYIENGSWPNNKPYAAIHRIASDGKVKGVFEKCLNFCKEQTDELRIDTHENNRIMQYLIEKNGFKKCGIVYMNDGSPRIAYQYSKDS